MMMTRNLNFITRGIIVLSILAILNPVLGSDSRSSSTSSMISISTRSTSTQSGGSGVTDDEIDLPITSLNAMKTLYYNQSKKDGKGMIEPVADSIFSHPPPKILTFGQLAHGIRAADKKDEFTKFKIFKDLAKRKLQTYKWYIRTQEKHIKELETSLSQKRSTIKDASITQKEEVLLKIIDRQIQPYVSRIDLEKKYLKELKSGEFATKVENRWLEHIDNDIETFLSTHQWRDDIEDDQEKERKLRDHLFQMWKDAEKNITKFEDEVDLHDDNIKFIHNEMKKNIYDKKKQYQQRLPLAVKLGEKYDELDTCTEHYRNQINTEFEHFKAKFQRKLGDFVEITDEEIIEQLEIEAAKEELRRQRRFSRREQSRQLRKQSSIKLRPEREEKDDRNGN